MLTDTRKSPFTKVTPLPWDAVVWTGGLWEKVTTTCTTAVVPHIEKIFNDANVSHVVENFLICAGEKEGKFGGTDFGDGDFYKWLEAAIYVGCRSHNTELLARVEKYIQLIAKSQEKDGYLSTKQIIGERLGNGVERFNNINDFEVYNFGHLFTTAALHYRLTQQTSLLDVAEKAAHYLKNMYHDAAAKGEVKTAVCPSHYMGLIELYRVTGKSEYLQLAKLTLALRDQVANGTDDNQDRLPLKAHEKIVGHAVRANYLYAGVADLYLEEGDDEYLTMLHKVWHNLLHKKLYITGGCGALYNGVSPYGNFFKDQKVHQAYGHEYQLPNITAYNETCAAIGNVLWAYRMFMIEPKAEYFDIIERTMLNVNLAAMNLSGDKFFYENMLRRTTDKTFDPVWSLTRTSYIKSFCCPPNLARTLAETSEYAYLCSDDSLYLGMYGENEATVALKNGASFKIKQETQYPFAGKITLQVSDINHVADFTLQIRIPGWLQKGQIIVGGKQITIDHQMAGCYYPLQLDATQSAVTIQINFELAVRYTVAHPYVEANNNQVAVERGPLVYCLETCDLEQGQVDDCWLDPTSTFQVAATDIAGQGIPTLKGEVYCRQNNFQDTEDLYQELDPTPFKKMTVQLIPYFAWDNRGLQEMRIWLPLALGGK